MLDLRNSDYLLPETGKLLTELVANAPFLEKYVLVGGTALSLHLCHRISEDLDFFTYSDNFDKKVITGISFKMMAIALVYIDDIEDENITHLEPKITISSREIRNFFEKKLK